MSRYGSDVPWWRVIRSDGRPPQGLEDEALEHWRAEGTPMVGGLRRGWPRRHGAGEVGLRRSGGGSGAVGGAGPRGGLHHVEIWVEDIAAAGREWGWLLGRLGYHLGDDWGHGQAWELGSLYVVVESGPDVVAGSARAQTRGPQPPCLPWRFAGRGRRARRRVRRGRVDADVRRPAPVCRWPAVTTPPTSRAARASRSSSSPLSSPDPRPSSASERNVRFARGSDSRRLRTLRPP